MEQMREARLSEAIALQIAELILSGEIKAKQNCVRKNWQKYYRYPGFRCGRHYSF